MDFFNTFIFSRPPPRPSQIDDRQDQCRHTVSGTPAEISRVIYNDIAFVDSQIKKYSEVTGILDHNSLYSKMYKMICDSHTREVNTLKIKHHCNTSSSNVAYHQDLIAAYKRILGELEDFNQILHNNYNKGIYDQHVSTFKNSTEIPDDQLRKIEDDAPDSLLDPISFQLFCDPVVAPSGITYEKSLLLDHINKQGPYDPLTRQSINTHQLYPNLAVKDSVANYIKQATIVL